MKCTSRLLFAGVLVISLCTCGCGKDVAIDKPYDISASATNAESEAMTDFDGSSASVHYFAEELCVAPKEQTYSDAVTDEVVEAMGVFLPSDKAISYQKNIYEKMYPASTTKILTAYLAIKQGNLEDMVTISENAVDQASDSSVCGLHAGDQIKLSDLLYGLMLRSGNDAAVAIAEHISGSEESFAQLMNDTARSFGATNSHFVNANGLHDEAHYTCVYDLYLIFAKAIEEDFFLQLIRTTSYTAYYTDASGAQASQTWTNTNKYLNGEVTQPEGITVLGGKTGTTNAAGYCLVLLSNNDKKEPVISIILKSDGRSNLYYVMNQVLANFAK
ncbi:MAG: serine hydrolase [bacterium]|nr:serine hydrolase [bacterium]MDY4099065.1 D-alanyl-D-alanine carboxypeptidase [Lachnospiraceae bacterium]